MGKKWYFLGFSLVVTVSGILSMLFWHGIPLNVDFKGGTIVTVRFSQSVHEDEIRAALHKAGVRDEKVQGVGPAANNELIIGLPTAPDERELVTGKQTI